MMSFREFLRLKDTDTYVSLTRYKLDESMIVNDCKDILLELNDEGIYPEINFKINKKKFIRYESKIEVYLANKDFRNNNVDEVLDRIREFLSYHGFKKIEK